MDGSSFAWHRRNREPEPTRDTVPKSTLMLPIFFWHYNPFFGKNAKWNISPKRV